MSITAVDTCTVRCMACDPCIYLGSQQIAPACVQSNLLGLGIGSWCCCVVEPMLTELVKTTTTTTTNSACQTQFALV